MHSDWGPGWVNGRGGKSKPEPGVLYAVLDYQATHDFENPKSCKKHGKHQVKITKMRGVKIIICDLTQAKMRGVKVMFAMVWASTVFVLKRF